MHVQIYSRVKNKSWTNQLSYQLDGHSFNNTIHYRHTHTKKTEEEEMQLFIRLIMENEFQNDN